MEGVEDTGGLTDGAIARRQALKAAIGGAAAAAVFVAPRIEGFSVAPDYASAASCTSGSGFTSHDTNGVACLGNGNAGFCGNWTSGAFAVTANNTAPILYATASLSGSLNGNDGNVNVNVNGITNNANQNCTTRSNSVNQNSGCGGWDTSNAAMVKVNNTGLSNLVSNRNDRNCNARAANMTIWVTVTCTCT